MKSLLDGNNMLQYEDVENYLVSYAIIQKGVISWMVYKVIWSFELETYIIQTAMLFSAFSSNNVVFYYCIHIGMFLPK